MENLPWTEMGACGETYGGNGESTGDPWWGEDGAQGDNTACPHPPQLVPAPLATYLGLQAHLE